MSAAPTSLAIFVYGTLQRGEDRSLVWPRRPRAVEIATTDAALYDLGSYPALAAGDDRVAGELWWFEPDDLLVTLAVLDAVEGYQQGEPDWYERRTIVCRPRRGGARSAEAYYFARELPADAARRVLAGADGLCRWRRRGGRPW